MYISRLLILLHDVHMYKYKNGIKINDKYIGKNCLAVNCVIEEFLLQLHNMFVANVTICVTSFMMKLDIRTVLHFGLN